MKHGVNLLAFLLQLTFLHAQVIKRESNESATQFAERVKPDSTLLAYPVLESSWDTLPVIIAFYEQTYTEPFSRQEYLRVIATLFIKTGNNDYSTTLIDTIYNEGGEPKIETMFFANADNDPNKELIFIASWEQKHYEVGGILYGTFIFDNLRTASGQKISFMNELSKQLDGGCECTWSDGTSKKAAFKTEADIVKALKLKGYKQ